MTKKSIIKFFRNLSKSKKQNAQYDNMSSVENDKMSLKHVEYKDEDNNIKIALVPKHMTVYYPSMQKDKSTSTSSLYTSSLYTPSEMSVDEKYKSSSQQENDSDYEEDIIDSYTYDSDDSEDGNMFKGKKSYGSMFDDSLTDSNSVNLYKKFDYSPRSSKDSKYSKLFNDKKEDDNISISSIDSVITNNTNNSDNIYINRHNKQKLDYILDKDISDDSSFFEKQSQDDSHIDSSSINSIYSYDLETLYK